MSTHQHAALIERRPIVATSLAEAREAARQLAGPSAEIVHRYLMQQQDCRELAQRLAEELRYCMEELAYHHQDFDLDDFTWHRDGSAVLAEFDAVVGDSDG